MPQEDAEACPHQVDFVLLAIDLLQCKQHAEELGHTFCIANEISSWSSFPEQNNFILSEGLNSAQSKDIIKKPVYTIIDKNKK